MKIAEFRAGLADLQCALRKWGAAKQAGELESLGSALAEFDELTISQLVKRIKAVNAPVKASKTPKPLNAAAIERYLSVLKTAAHSSDSFDKAVDQAVADKTELPTAELKELARQFSGSVPEKATRPAIGAFLKARRLETRRQEGLGATIDRMFGGRS
jgi:hypothetical protein